MILFKRNIQEKVDHRQQISLDDGKKKDYKRKKETTCKCDGNNIFNIYLFFYAYIKLIPPRCIQSSVFFPSNFVLHILMLCGL